MNPETIFIPVLLQILLVVIVLLVMNVRKNRYYKAGEVDFSKTALDSKAWPVDVVKTSNSLVNQFQVPVLFYVICIMLYLLDGVNSFALILAWVFVISRYVHAYIHMGKNYVPHRKLVFKMGCYTLLVMILYTFWVLLFDS